MRIPKFFTLFGQPIQVSIDNEYCQRINAYGDCSPREDNIVLCNRSDGKKRSDTQLQHTFYHEKVHLILFKMNENELAKNEKFVDVFSALLLESELTKK